MKKLFFYAAALLAAISFAACSDDDGETELPITSDNIVGTWKIVKGEEGEIYEGEADSWTENYPDEDGWYYTFTFNEDGSFIYVEYIHGEESERDTGTYSVSGNKLTIADCYFADEYEIKKLTESQLVLFSSGATSEGSWESTKTFKRITAYTGGGEPTVPPTDPDGPVPPSNKIIGTWQIVSEVGREIDNRTGKVDSLSINYPDGDGWYYTLTYNTDGSWNVIEYTHEKETSRTNGTYSISDNTLTMVSKSEPDSFKREIKKLTDSELVFFDDDSDSESLWQATVTYKRIK